jgi:capsular polysaccharide biosynthesis protein
MKLYLTLKYYLTLFLKSKGCAFGKLVSFDELSQHDPNVGVLYCKNTRLFYCAPFYSGEPLPERYEGMEYVQYALHLKKATLLGDSSMIKLSGNRVLYDLPFYDDSHRYDYASDFKVIKIKGKRVIYLRGKKNKIDKAIWMGGNFSWNYYHLMYEFIVKFRFLEQLDIPLDIPVLIDEACFRVPQFRNLVEISNTKGYKILTVGRLDRYETKEMYYINCPNFISPNIARNSKGSSADIQFDLEALTGLRDFLLPFASSRKFAKRIFLSRKNASGRRVFNEEEVIDVFTGFGFEVVHPEELSISDQISLFNQAEWIAGGSGAAFTNLLFGSKNCKAFIFYSYHSTFSGFSTIASAFGVNLRYITEADAHPDMQDVNLHSAFKIDIPYLRDLLREYGL